MMLLGTPKVTKVCQKKKYVCVVYKVIAAVTMESTAFWNAARGQCLHHQGRMVGETRSSWLSTPEMESVIPSETSVDFNRTARRYNAEDFSVSLVLIYRLLNDAASTTCVTYLTTFTPEREYG
jgi:hypothetical protein